MAAAPPHASCTEPEAYVMWHAAHELTGALVRRLLCRLLCRLLPAWPSEPNGSVEILDRSSCTAVPLTDSTHT